jgi:aarF domain-containing kinase
VQGVRAFFARVAAQRGTTLAAFEAEQTALYASGALRRKRGDGVAAAEGAKMARVRRLLGWWDALRNAPRACWNWTGGWLLGSRGQLPYVRTPPPLNLGAILDTLLCVHACEIFQHGAFNGDPHPGNVMLMDDGRLGLVDYGQVKHLDLATRVSYAKLTVALARDVRGSQTAEIARIFREELKARSKHGREDILYRLVCFWNDRNYGDDVVPAGMNVQTFLDWCEAEDPVEEIPQDTVMASRVSVLLRGMGNAFGLELRTSPVWRPYAERLLREQGIDY